MLALALFALPILQAVAYPSNWDSGLTAQQPLESHQDDNIKVPLTLGVASQGPNSLIVENLFDQVLKKVGDKVDLSLVYVAELDDSDQDFGVSCGRGPIECAGNIQQLCAQKYLDWSTWWSFIHCQNFQGASKIGTPQVAFKCAKIAGFDWDDSGLGQCAGSDAEGKSTEGIRLLKDSVLLSKTMGIEKPCTIHINAEQNCMRDGTWKGCDDGHTVQDFTRVVNEEYSRLNDN